MKKNSNPLVSVVMSTYNNDSSLRNAIESIICQVYENLEFIIINNGSTDNTDKILNEYKVKDKRIKIIVNQKNLSLSTALNQGINEAKGRYIARMDADDISLPYRIKRQVEYMENHELCGVLGTFYDELVGDQISPRRQNPIDDSSIRSSIPYYNPIAHPTVMVRTFQLKTLIASEGFAYNPKYKYSQDYDLWVRMKYSGCGFHNIPEILLIRNFKPDSKKMRCQLKEDILIKLNMLRLDRKRIKGSSSTYNRPNYISYDCLIKSFLLLFIPSFIREKIRIFREGNYYSNR